MDKSKKKKYTSSTSTVLEKLASQPLKCWGAQHREGKEKKTVAELAKPHLYHLQAVTLVAREGVGWSHSASHKVLLEIVLTYSGVVSGGGRRLETMQGHLATRQMLQIGLHYQCELTRRHKKVTLPQVRDRKLPWRPRSHKNTHYKNCSLQRHVIHIQLCFRNLEKSIQLLLVLWPGWRTWA